MSKTAEARNGGMVAALEPYHTVAIGDYREAVRLYAFYQGSKFSTRPNKGSKSEAEHYRNAAHKILASITEPMRRGHG